MSYDFHITSPNGIDLRLWKLTASEVGIQLIPPGNLSATQFGRTVSIKNNDGDGVLSYGILKSIRFNYRDGEVSFRAPDDWESAKEELKQILKSILMKLDANIIGDEGEKIEL